MHAKQRQTTSSSDSTSVRIPCRSTIVAGRQSLVGVRSGGGVGVGAYHPLSTHEKLNSITNPKIKTSVANQRLHKTTHRLLRHLHYHNSPKMQRLNVVGHYLHWPKLNTPAPQLPQLNKYLKNEGTSAGANYPSIS